MMDIVTPRKGSEQKFISQAQELGFDELVLAYDFADAKKLSQKEIRELKKAEINVTLAFFCDKSISLEGFDICIGLGTKINSVFRGLDFLLNNENEEEKDFIHQRRSGLNHVLLSECKQKNISIIAGLNQLRHISKEEQAIILGRMMQNAKLCRKKGVSYSVVSMAQEIHEMKSARDLRLFSLQLQ